MSIVRFIICDDEENTCHMIREVVCGFLQERELSGEVDIFLSGEAALCSETVYDIALLDIQIGDITGITLARRLQRRNPHLIVFFITSHDNFLDDAFDVCAFRYLCKPVRVERLKAGLSAAVERYRSLVKSVLITSGAQTVQVHMHDIVYVCIDGRKTKVVTTAQAYLTAEKLTRWRELLPEDLFSQPHSSYLVNLKYVQSITTKSVVILYGGKQEELCVSQRKYQQFKRDFMMMVGNRL